MIKEYTRPLEQGIDSDKNIFSVLEERVERTPDDNLVEYKNAQGEWAAVHRCGVQKQGRRPRQRTYRSWRNAWRFGIHYRAYLLAVDRA